MLTLSASVLLQHGMRMWPQMIDTIFWPFAFKAATEHHNCLSFKKDRQTPISILHGVTSRTITVKSFHTLHRALAALAHQNGNLGVALACTWGIPPFTLAAWLLFLTHTPVASHHSSTWSLTIRSQPFLLWITAWSLLIEKTYTNIPPREQPMKSSILLKSG